MAQRYGESAASSAHVALPMPFLLSFVLYEGSHEMRVNE